MPGHIVIKLMNSIHKNTLKALDRKDAAQAGEQWLNGGRFFI